MAGTCDAHKCVRRPDIRHVSAWRLRIDDYAAERFCVLLMGSAGALQAALDRILIREGWQPLEASLAQPLAADITWQGAALIIGLSETVAETEALLERLRRIHDAGPWLLLAHAPTCAQRRQAFMQGALDVIALPADWSALEARLRVILHELHRQRGAPGDVVS